MAYGSVKQRVKGFLSPLARLVADLGISPAAITVTGFLFSVLAAVSLGTGHFVWAALLMLLAGVCDGQPNSKRGASALFAHEIDVPFVIHDNIFAQKQSHSAAG